MLRHRVDDEGEEQCENGEDDQSDYIFLELLPDEEDKGLHRVDEPVKAGGGTTSGKTGNSFHLFRPVLSLQKAITLWSHLNIKNFLSKFSLFQLDHCNKLIHS